MCDIQCCEGIFLLKPLLIIAKADINTDKADLSRPEILLDFSINNLSGKLNSAQYQQLNKIVEWLAEWEKKKNV